MMDTKHTESFKLKPLKMGDNESKVETIVETCSLLDRTNTDERQVRVLEHSTSREDEPSQEEEEGSIDHRDDLMSSEDCAQILEAVKRGDFKTLSSLLTDCMTKYANDSERNTALHCTVSSVSHRGNSDDSFYHCFVLLTKWQQMKLNMPNKEAYIAVGYELNEIHRTCFEHMLKHPSAKRLHLDYYPEDSEFTLREIILETYPDLESHLPAPLMESLDLSERDIKLLAALQRGEFNIFSETLNSNNPNPWYDEPYRSSLLEIACQMKNRKKFVKLLLANGADPNTKNRVTGMPLLHATARSGNFVQLKILLEMLQKNKEINIMSLKDKADRTVLHWLARLSERKAGDKRNLKDCLNLLLHPDSSWKVGTEDRDSSGNTALYIAVEGALRDRAKLLLSEGADVRVFEHGSKILLSDSLSIVKEILDDCLLSNDKPLTSTDLQLRLNYQSFMNIVPHIAESELHSDLLTHPVMSTFLILKWENVRFIFFLDVFFYVIFLCFLTAYILLSELHNTPKDGGAASNTTNPFGFNDSCTESGMCDPNFTSQTNSSSLLFLQGLLMVSLFLLTLREIVQLIVHRWVYVKSLENWLEILLIISTFISCSGVAEGAELKLHFSAIALLLGWFELLMLSGRLPQLSVQLEMLRTVSLTFLKFMAGYVTLLIAFAFSFYILFRGSTEKGGAVMFTNPAVSLLKTIVMFTGEFDASSLSFATLPYTSHVIFLLFVVLVAIVLLNLLNGLAVSDTGEIRKDAERLSLAARATLIARIEGLLNILPKRLKPDIELKKEMFVIYPNRKNRIGSAAVRALLSIISERKPNKKDKSTGIQEEWSLFTKKLSALELRQEELEKKLRSTLDESRQMFEQLLAGLNIPKRETVHHEV